MPKRSKLKWSRRCWKKRSWKPGSGALRAVAGRGPQRRRRAGDGDGDGEWAGGAATHPPSGGRAARAPAGGPGPKQRSPCRLPRAPVTWAGSRGRRGALLPPGPTCSRRPLSPWRPSPWGACAVAASGLCPPTPRAPWPLPRGPSRARRGEAEGPWGSGSLGHLHGLPPHWLVLQPRLHPELR